MSILVARFPLPARLEEFPEFEFRESVSFGIEDDVCQGQDVCGAEEEVEIFQRFGLGGGGCVSMYVRVGKGQKNRSRTYEPETLHVISRRCGDLLDAVDAAVASTALDGRVLDE